MDGSLLPCFLEWVWIYLQSGTAHCDISDNCVSDNYVGIHLSNADDNEITCNWVAHNDQRGFSLANGSTGNNISYNNIMSNGDSISGGWQWNFYNNQSDAVVAEHNYWRTTSSAVIAAGIKENPGSVDYEPFETSPPPCAPIPEAATVLLFAVGLLMLAGYARIGRKT